MKSKYHFKFEELLVYQKAMDFSDMVAINIANFPREARYELTSQFIRAADSISLNIAEGSGGTDKQFYNYLRTAWNSCQECVSCNSKALRRGYITFEQSENSRKELSELSKMIMSLMNKIKNRLNS